MKYYTQNEVIIYIILGTIVSPNKILLNCFLKMLYSNRKASSSGDRIAPTAEEKNVHAFAVSCASCEACARTSQAGPP